MARIIIAFVQLFLAASAFAQTPAALGESAKGILGSWEFSNADRDKICTATFKTDRTAVGFKVEFDANCASLFPLVSDIAGWTFPDDDLLRFVDGRGRVLVEFSEVEDGIYEAPTPGAGVLFLQNAAAAGGPAPKSPGEVAGDWTVMQHDKALCSFALAATAVKDAFALTVKPGCDASIARLGFAQWRLERGELMLVPGRGSPWRFEEIDTTTWRRLPESNEAITLVRQ